MRGIPGRPACSRSSSRTRVRSALRTHPAATWIAAFAVLGAALAARNLTALSTTPPGLYVDEASIGYNAWTVANFGVDEHGHSLPLYFEAFGEYKNPVYVYALVPFARFLPLTATTERLPAALFGLVAVVFIALTAWRLTRSRWITILVALAAALTPWLVEESRVGFEVISMVTTLGLAIWCLADERRMTPGRFALAGLFLALSIFAYSTGRVEVALFTGAFAFAYWRRGLRGWWLTVAVVAAGYVVLGVWWLLHPGALTAEFGLRSIAADGAPLPTLFGRFVSNYASYFSVDFLFIHGDANPRHNTGYAGMLLAAMLPLLLLGLGGCWRRRHEALPKFVVLSLLVGPASASVVDNGGLPHALRSACMLPFWFLLLVFGVETARDLVRPRRLAAALVTAALVAQGALYTVDMYTAYPVRAAAVFDDGLVQAVGTAWHAAAGQHVFISTTFEGESAYIDADFALRPAPPATYSAGNPQMTLLGCSVVDAAQISSAARPGDVAVLAPQDPVPAGAVHILTEYGPTDPLGGSARPQPMAAVYRLMG